MIFKRADLPLSPLPSGPHPVREGSDVCMFNHVCLMLFVYPINPYRRGRQGKREGEKRGMEEGEEGEEEEGEGRGKEEFCARAKRAPLQKGGGRRGAGGGGKGTGGGEAYPLSTPSYRTTSSGTKVTLVLGKQGR